MTCEDGVIYLRSMRHFARETPLKWSRNLSR